MAIKLNYTDENIIAKHRFTDHWAFLDEDKDFWLIDTSKKVVCRIAPKGCICESIENFETIEDFLDEKYDCGVAKVFTNIADYTITIDC